MLCDKGFLNEAGVSYTFRPASGFFVFKYQWQLIGGQPCEDVVYCRNHADFIKLLAYWDSKRPGIWNYKEV